MQETIGKNTNYFSKFKKLIKKIIRKNMIINKIINKAINKKPEFIAKIKIFIYAIIFITSNIQSDEPQITDTTQSDANKLNEQKSDINKLNESKPDEQKSDESKLNQPEVDKPEEKKLPKEIEETIGMLEYQGKDITAALTLFTYSIDFYKAVSQFGHAVHNKTPITIHNVEKLLSNQQNKDYENFCIDPLLLIWRAIKFHKITNLGEKKLGFEIKTFLTEQRYNDFANIFSHNTFVTLYLAINFHQIISKYGHIIYDTTEVEKAEEQLQTIKKDLADFLEYLYIHPKLSDQEKFFASAHIVATIRNKQLEYWRKNQIEWYKAWNQKLMQSIDTFWYKVPDKRVEIKKMFSYFLSPWHCQKLNKMDVYPTCENIEQLCKNAHNCEGLLRRILYLDIIRKDPNGTFILQELLNKISPSFDYTTLYNAIKKMATKSTFKQFAKLGCLFNYSNRLNYSSSRYHTPNIVFSLPLGNGEGLNEVVMRNTQFHCCGTEPMEIDDQLYDLFKYEIGALFLLPIITEYICFNIFYEKVNADGMETAAARREKLDQLDTGDFTGSQLILKDSEFLFGQDAEVTKKIKQYIEREKADLKTLGTEDFDEWKKIASKDAYLAGDLPAQEEWSYKNEVPDFDYESDRT